MKKSLTEMNTFVPIHVIFCSMVDWNFLFGETILHPEKIFIECQLQPRWVEPLKIVGLQDNLFVIE